MQFDFNGVELDALKPVYIMGYQIRSWFPTRPLNSADKYWLSYPAVTKRCFITSINFAHSNKAHRITSIDIFIEKCGSYRILASDGAFICKSPQACKKAFEKYLKERGEKDDV